MFGIKFIKVQPTTYLLQYRGGKIVREGLGLSFFYYAPTTSLVAVPVASADVPFIFQETTADFQTVTIQGQVTYRVGDAKRLAALLNYTLAPNGQTYASEDPEKLPERVIHVINVLARAELQKLPLREAIRASDELVQAVKAGLVAADEITSLGSGSARPLDPGHQADPGDRAGPRSRDPREDVPRSGRGHLCPAQLGGGAGARDQGKRAEHRDRHREQEAPDPRNPDGRRAGGAGEGSTCSKRKRSKPTSAWKTGARAWSRWRRRMPRPRRTPGPTACRAR